MTPASGSSAARRLGEVGLAVGDRPGWARASRPSSPPPAWRSATRPARRRPSPAPARRPGSPAPGRSARRRPCRRPAAACRCGPGPRRAGPTCGRRSAPGWRRTFGCHRDVGPSATTAHRLPVRLSGPARSRPTSPRRPATSGRRGWPCPCRRSGRTEADRDRHRPGAQPPGDLGERRGDLRRRHARCTTYRAGPGCGPTTPGERRRPRRAAARSCSDCARCCCQATPPPTPPSTTAPAMTEMTTVRRFILTSNSMRPSAAAQTRPRRGDRPRGRYRGCAGCRASWSSPWQAQAMKSTMQTTPLLISQLLRYGTTLHADQEVVTWTADGAPPARRYRRGRHARPPSWPTPCAASASPVTSASPRSCGTTPST